MVAEKRDSSDPGAGLGGGFPETLWSVIARRKSDDSAEAAEALAHLCRLYHPAIRNVLARWGHPRSEMDDILQDFFATKFLNPSFFGNVRPGQGKFRTFLKVALKNFLKTRHRQRRRELLLVSLESSKDGLAEQLEADELPPDEWIDQAFASQLLQNAKARLEDEARKAGKSQLCDLLWPLLDGAMDAPRIGEVAEKLGMTENHAGVALHRLRERLRWLIREEVRQTVANPSEWKEELDHLVAILRS